MPRPRKYFTEDERKEASRAACRAYYAKNRQKMMARSMAYYQAHREQIRVRNREFYRRKKLERKG